MVMAMAMVHGYKFYLSIGVGMTRAVPMTSRTMLLRKARLRGSSLAYLSNGTCVHGALSSP